MAIPFDPLDPALPAPTGADGRIPVPREASVSEGSRETTEARFDRLLRDHGPALSRLAFGYEKVAAAREELIQEITLAATP